MSDKKKEGTPLNKGRAQFMLIGKAKVTDYTFDLNHTFESGWTSNIMNLGVDCGKGNVVYAEMSGGYFPEKYKKDNLIYVHGIKEENGRKIDDYENSYTIDWNDRNDEEIISEIGSGCFLTVGVEKDNKDKTFYKNFLTEYDAVEYLKEHLEDEMVVIVKGNLTYESDGENVYTKKKIRSIALSKAEPEDFKATFTQTILLDKDSIGKLNKDSETPAVAISAYVVDYVGSLKVGNEKIKVKKNFAYPVNYEFAIGEKPELSGKVLEKYFKAKKEEIIEITVDGNIVEGAAIVNISVDDIPDDIKELIELGLYTEEEALAKCAVGGNTREKRMIILKPSITYVGDGDDRKPTVSINKDKYKTSDISLFSAYYAALDTENDKPEDDEKTTDDEEDDLLSMLDALNG